jgi:hypothetical protein
MPLTSLAGAVEPHTTAVQEKGISIYFGDQDQYKGAAMTTQAQQLFFYVKSLAANEVSIAVPFYMIGQSPTNSAQTANGVVSGPGTPSVADLQTMVKTAIADGLKVQVRFILSEEGDNTLMTRKWRGTIVPKNMTAWFTSYWNWMHPYVTMLQSRHASSLGIDTELNSLVNQKTQWASLVKKVIAIFKGRLVYSATTPTRTTSIPNMAFGLDAYASISIPSTTTVTTQNAVGLFQPRIYHNYTSPGLGAPLYAVRLEEIGLPAYYGAWTAPNNYSPLNQKTGAWWVTAAWFTANCNIFFKYHLTGIYFWGLNVNYFTPTFNASAVNAIAQWQGTTAAQAIQTCFKRTH